MFGRSSGKSMLLAGVIGAALGMYVMNRFDGTATEQKLRLRGREMMRGVRGMGKNTSMLGNIYEAGRSAVDNGMERFKH